MAENPKIWHYDHPLQLEKGGELPALQLAYQTWGEFNEARDNVLLVVHALTGNTDVSEWWGPLLGPGKSLDTENYFVICINNLGSPYGSTSPLTFKKKGLDPTTFPEITIRDIVRSQKLLLDHLGVKKLQSVLGGSLGGMVSLEWPLLYPDVVDTFVTIGSTAKHSAWCIGISDLQRDAIMSDPAWNNGNYETQPVNGLSLARKIAMVSYRSSQSFEQRFGRELKDEQNTYFQVESYLDYQGKKLVKRFDANCYIEMTKIMDTHNIGRGRNSHIQALKRLHQPGLVLSIDSDILYPPEDQREIFSNLPNGQWYQIKSVHGHDGFLIESEQVEEALNNFAAKCWSGDRPESCGLQHKYEECIEVP